MARLNSARLWRAVGLKLTYDAMYGIIRGMPHTYRSFHVHIIFHVKHCNILTEDVASLHAYMRAVMADMGCLAIIVGGTEDHVHILADFPPDSIGKTISKVKTTATRWLKRRNPAFYHSFAWQTGSGQFTVSYSATEKVRQYIGSQREHHQRISSREEFIRFLEHHNVPHTDESYLPIVD